jgi:hypothetical protein
MKMNGKPGSSSSTLKSHQVLKTLVCLPGCRLPTTTNIEGHNVLSEYRQRNRAVKPPTLNRLRGTGLQQHANDIEHHSSLPSDGEDQVESGTALSSLRRSAKDEASFLRFYTQFPGWFSTLEIAKAKFRLYISTILPFPTTEQHSSFASTCITEAMTDYHRDNAGMPVLDECKAGISIL